MEKTAFDFMNIPERPEKPRETGLTMMVDFGMGVARQRDLVQVAGAYIDIDITGPTDTVTQGGRSHCIGTRATPGGVGNRHDPIGICHASDGTEGRTTVIGGQFETNHFIHNGNAIHIDNYRSNRTRLFWANG